MNQIRELWNPAFSAYTSVLITILVCKLTGLHPPWQIQPYLMDPSNLARGMADPAMPQLTSFLSPLHQLSLASSDQAPSPQGLLSVLGNLGNRPSRMAKWRKTSAWHQDFQWYNHQHNQLTSPIQTDQELKVLIQMQGDIEVFALYNVFWQCLGAK